jgi:hypothetical protein
MPPHLYGPNIHTREPACAFAESPFYSLNYVLGFIHFFLSPLSVSLGVLVLVPARSPQHDMADAASPTVPAALAAA